jgi:hypothetical protein
MTTSEMRELMTGIIGPVNIASVACGVVVPIRDGIDLPMPSGTHRLRVENDYAAHLFRVSRGMDTCRAVPGVPVVQGDSLPSCYSRRSPVWQPFWRMVASAGMATSGWCIACRMATVPGW